MPLYEYECETCARRFERIQKFSDPLVDTCPFCGAGVRKLLSSPAIQFKGSGWYVTDYAQKGRPDSSKGDSGKDAEGSSAKDTAAGSGTGTEKSSSDESNKGSSGESRKTASGESAPSGPTKSDSGGTSTKQS